VSLGIFSWSFRSLHGTRYGIEAIIGFEANNLLPHLLAPHTTRLVSLLGSFDETAESAIEEAFGGSTYIGYHTGVVLMAKRSHQIFRMHTVLERPLGVELPPCPLCRGNTKGSQRGPLRIEIRCANPKCHTTGYVNTNQGVLYGSFAAHRGDLTNYRWVDASRACWENIPLRWKINGEAPIELISKEFRSSASVNLSVPSKMASPSMQRDDAFAIPPTLPTPDSSRDPKVGEALKLTLKAMHNMQGELERLTQLLGSYGVNTDSHSSYEWTLERLAVLGIDGKNMTK
jgi:hypothetical protein